MMMKMMEGTAAVRAHQAVRQIPRMRTAERDQVQHFSCKLKVKGFGSDGENGLVTQIFVKGCAICLTHSACNAVTGFTYSQAAEQ